MPSASALSANTNSSTRETSSGSRSRRLVSITSMRLKVEPRQVELFGIFHRRQGNGEVLDREPRGVEDGDFILGLTARRLICEDVAELSDVLTRQRARLDCVHQVAVV